MSVITRDLSDADLKLFCDYANRLTGIQLGPGKRHLIISRLIRRVRALGLPDLASYGRYLTTNLAREQTDFINAITTNLTSFFRENHHFQTLPTIGDTWRMGDLRIWSAGCSTGMEPYSIAMTMADTGLLERTQIQATDIDTQVLEIATRGEYKYVEIEDIDPAAQRRHFVRGVGRNEGLVRAKDYLRDSITFSQVNLLRDWPKMPLFHAIFCRNVLIYFDQDTQTMLFRKFAAQLVTGGLLFLGHSETIKVNEGHLKLIGRTTYRKLEGSELKTA
ncbi:MAG: protein-glutamate O-methyltransferase CheR [Pseudomonadales bacterium]|nr:protein-glutamate O-methyltransferase CheR [Pseudomonadales bacterium]MCP5185266.1 protein-glutamate O-methyltransferase CheR [Pseudomonadales bacterium]